MVRCGNGVFLLPLCFVIWHSRKKTNLNSLENYHSCSLGTSSLSGICLPPSHLGLCLEIVFLFGNQGFLLYSFLSRIKNSQYTVSLERALPASNFSSFLSRNVLRKNFLVIKKYQPNRYGLKRKPGTLSRIYSKYWICNQLRT